MRALTTFCFLLFISFCVNGQSAQVNLIPKPSKITPAEGLYRISDDIHLYVADSFASVADLLTEYPKLKTSAAELVKKVGKKHQQGIRLFLAEPIDKIAADAHRITIDESGILLKANNEKAMLEAILTLVQLAFLQDDPLQLPQLIIDDSPRFAYRGLHLDVASHYMPFAFLKKYIDLMAIYKYNYFHLQLADANGWRLEVKQYPKLTEQAAWRTHKTWREWHNNGLQYSKKGQPNAHGGFYSQKQIKELVAYAHKRGITIIPELQIPTNAAEVLAIYPELSCSGKAYAQQEFCLGNTGSYTFFKNVLNELTELFPSPYIHIGGEQADMQHWANCPKCQALKAKENLASDTALYNYGIKQIENHLAAQGRTMLGRTAILSDSLSKKTIIMSTDLDGSTAKAAAQGHNIILTTRNQLYFDSYQSDPRNQPLANDKQLPLEQVYAYEPAQTTAETAKKIIGLQATVPTAFMPNYEQVEYMVFPRALALAELSWSKQEQRNWNDFEQRLQAHYKILQDKEVNYYRPSYHVKIGTTFNMEKKSNTITLNSEQLNPVIYYTTDGTEPTAEATLFMNPVELTTSTLIKAASFIDKARVSPIIEKQVHVHKAIGKKVTYNIPWNDYPAQKDSTLTNGVHGDLNDIPQQWQGFAKGLDVTIDFERREEINSVAIRFMQTSNPEAYYPDDVHVFLSDNGKNYRSIGSATNKHKDADVQIGFRSFDIKLDKPQMAKYIKVVASKPTAGYLLTDEIVVY